MVLLLMVAFLLIALIEVPLMVINEQRRELRAFWVVMAMAFFLSLGVVRRWPMPNPTDVIEAIFKPAADQWGLK